MGAWAIPLLLVAFLLVLLSIPYMPSFISGNPTFFPIFMLVFAGGFIYAFIKVAL